MFKPAAKTLQIYATNMTYFAKYASISTAASFIQN